jgi:hypothetical protein
MKISYPHQVELINASKFGIEHVEMTIEKLKAECPDAFHTASTLVKRRFHHQPTSDTPCRGFVADRDS